MSTCSDYFHEIFERTPCKQPVVVLKDIRQSDLESLLDYMYIGEVDVKQSDLAGLIKAAECLRIKGLAVPDEDPSTATLGGGSSSKLTNSKLKSNNSNINNVPDNRRTSSGGGGFSSPTPPSKRQRRDSGGGYSSNRTWSGRGSSSTSPVPHNRETGVGKDKGRSSSPSAISNNSNTSGDNSVSQNSNRVNNVNSVTSVPSQSHTNVPDATTDGKQSSSTSHKPPLIKHHKREAPSPTPDAAGDDPDILPVEDIKVERDDTNQHPDLSDGGRDISHGDDDDGGGMMGDDDDMTNSDFPAYSQDDIEKQEIDNMDYNSDQMAGPSGMQAVRLFIFFF